MKGERDKAQRFWCNVEIGYIYYRYIIRYMSSGIQYVFYIYYRYIIRCMSLGIPLEATSDKKKMVERYESCIHFRS